ncbi:MAG: NAD(P)-dependent oxidoreductase, partial [Pseudomonadota bacterium]|nr:NAD(P)-dependent oxidoreductase [Pseudomonadota bacterium]
MSNLLCIGLGYSARVLAARMVAKGWAVAGTARGGDGVARIAALGYEGICFDGSRPSPGIQASLATATHL